MMVIIIIITFIQEGISRNWNLSDIKDLFRKTILAKIVSKYDT